MAKFAILFVAFLAIHAIVARQERMGDHLREMKQQFSTIRQEILDKIHHVNGIHYLATYTNDFIFNLNTIVYRLYKIILRTDEKDGHRIIPQVTMTLSDIAHELRQTIIAQPNQLKKTLEDKVAKVTVQGERLIEVVQHFEENRDQEGISHDVKDVLEKIFKALRVFQALQSRRYEAPINVHNITYETCEEILKEVYEALQNISKYDRETAQYVVNEGYKLSKFLAHIVRHMDKEVYHLDQATKRIVNDIALKLREIRKKLDDRLESVQRSSPTEVVKQMKDYLKTCVQDYAQQVETLHDMQNPGDNQYLRQLIKQVVFDCATTTKMLHWKLESIIEGHPF